MQYQSESSLHHPHASERLFSSAFDLYSDRRNHLSGHHADMLLFIKHNRCHYHKSFGIFRAHCYAIPKYRYWVLVSQEANIIGYWILGAIFWYRSNPTIYYNTGLKPRVFITVRLPIVRDLCQFYSFALILSVYFYSVTTVS